MLFTGKAIAKFVDEDIPLVAAASDKQRSRIQIKKGPNGQEYEYEYVYYYYDDDDEPKDKVNLFSYRISLSRNHIFLKFLKNYLMKNLYKKPDPCKNFLIFFPIL